MNTCTIGFLEACCWQEGRKVPGTAAYMYFTIRHSCTVGYLFRRYCMSGVESTQNLLIINSVPAERLFVAQKIGKKPKLQETNCGSPGAHGG